MPSGFVCRQCGSTHDGLTTDIGFKLPDDVWAIPKEERESRATFNSDVCRFEGRCFIRGILYVPIVGRNESFAWGVWAEVEKRIMMRYVEIFSEDRSNEPLYDGTLANRLSSYPDAAGERVTVRFGDAASRPEFLLDGASNSSLARDQRTGIDESRYHEILVANGAV